MNPNINERSYWENILPGTMIEIAGCAGPYETGDILTLIEENRSIQYKLIHLSGFDDQLWLAVDISNFSVKFRVLWEDDEGFPSGTRSDIIDRSDNWLFQEPSSSNYVPGELSFTEAIEWNYEDGTGSHVFGKKISGQFDGFCSIFPPEPENEELSVTVAEYETRDSIEDTQIMVIEIGRQNLRNGEIEPDGGEIRILFGCPISDRDIDIGA